MPSVGTLWSAVASVRSGRRTRATGQAQPVEGLRARDLVDEVQVDVQQAVRYLVALPDLVEQRLWHRSLARRQLRRSPARDHREEHGLSSAVGFSKWWGRSASKVTQSPSRELVTLAVADAARPLPGSTSAVSRLPGSCIGGSPGPPVAAPGASVWRESSARCPGSGGGQDLVAVPAARLCPCAALAGAHDRHRPVLIQAQQLGQPQLEPGGDARRDVQRRARLAPLDLREHRRADAGAQRQVAQRQRLGLAQRFHPRPDRDRIERVRRRGQMLRGGCSDGARCLGWRHTRVRYHRRAYDALHAWTPTHMRPVGARGSPAGLTKTPTAHEPPVDPRAASGRLYGPAGSGSPTASAEASARARATDSART